MSGLSNYPPGHPTGTSHGEPTEVYYCDRCNYLLTLDELKHVNILDSPVQDDNAMLECPHCKSCEHVERAICDCGKPATHIDTDRAVNAHEAFCDEHGM